MVFPAPRLLVFDLDGTLIDSRVDLCNSVNAMLSHYGKDLLAEPTIASYIGDGASTLVRRALAHAHLVADEPDPHDEAFIVEATGWFIDWYRVHKLDYTYIYPGVVESLSFLREKHPLLPMAVLTNKPVHPSRDICRHFKLDQYCYQIYGGNSFDTKKPDPEGLLTLIAEAERLTSTVISPAEVVMIGDSHVDVKTARACGAWSLGCTFGLSPESLAAAGPDISVDHASDWPRALNLL
jgi:phosphoglycolate phosphatase